MADGFSLSSRNSVAFSHHHEEPYPFHFSRANALAQRHEPPTQLSRATG